MESGHDGGEHKLRRLDRFCMLFISIVVFLLCESYLIKMLTFMLDTKYERHLQTIDELIASDVPLCIDPTEESFYRSIDSGLVSKLHLENTSQELRCNCSYCHSCDWARYFVGSKENVDPATGFNKFYILKEQLFGNATFHVFMRTDLLVEYFEWFGLRLFGTGIWKHWVENYWRDITNRPREEAVVMLTMQDLITLWRILEYGSALSFIVLIMEFAIYARIKHCKKNN
ncbi:hypothetical protein pipiens_013613 [Culex pipiens pipiens]|uniref:Uncharacterized protein n=1 Tax=Culex pipiens pipiens TaxID=38569 RepID=A0ABD1CXQ9_CULPP